MKNIITRLVREPNLILGVVVSGLSLLVLFGVHLTGDQMAGIGVFLGAVIALVRFLTTPANEVIAQKKPDGTIVGGAVLGPTGKGELVEVNVGLSPPPGDVDPEPPLPPVNEHHG